MRIERPFRPLLELQSKSDPWLLFKQHAGDLFLEETLQDDDQLITSVQRLAQRPPDQSLVLIRKVAAIQPRFDRLLKALKHAIDVRTVRGSTMSPTQQSADESDRGQIIRIRKEMISQAGGTYSSEGLATAAKSTTTNSSQLAADQRNSGKIFGVRLGREWHYPRFQFDKRLRALPEMKAILAALSPDEQGWDRLQWFLKSHEKLNGRTPLQVWKADPQKAVEAANTERWNGRD